MEPYGLEDQDMFVIFVDYLAHEINIEIQRRINEAEDDDLS